MRGARLAVVNAHPDQETAGRLHCLDERGDARGQRDRVDRWTDRRGEVRLLRAALAEVPSRVPLEHAQMRGAAFDPLTALRSVDPGELALEGGVVSGAAYVGGEALFGD